MGDATNNLNGLAQKLFSSPKSRLFSTVILFSLIGASMTAITFARTASYLPIPPEPISPALGETVEEPPTLEWSRMDRVRGYTVAITTSNDTDFNFATTERVKGETYEPEIMDEGEYIWRVQARGRRRATSPWSQTYGFSYVKPVATEGQQEQEAPDSESSQILSRIEIEAYRDGGEGEGYHDADAENKGDGTCRNDDVDLKQRGVGNCVLGWFDEYEWLAYDIEVSESGDYNLTANVANGLSSDTGFAVEVGGDVVADVTISPTGAWDELTEVDGGKISLKTGSHTMYIKRTVDFVDIDWIEFGGPGTVSIPSGEPEVPEPVKILSRIEAEAYRGGGEGVGYHDVSLDNKGDGTCRNDAVDMKQVGENNCTIGWFGEGEWLAYELNVSKSGSYGLSTRVANGLSRPSGFALEVNGDVVANVPVNSTGSWGSFEEVSYGSVDLEAGKNLVFIRRTVDYVDIDWLEFYGFGEVTVDYSDIGDSPDPEDPDPTPTPDPTPPPTTPPTSSSNRGPQSSIKCPSSSVSISPGQNIQTIVNGNNAGTIYCLKSGVHRGQEVLPKNGDQYIGEFGAVMDGENNSAYAFLTWDPSVRNVVIRNLEITGYNLNNPSHAAIYGSQADGWEVSNNEIHRNRYAGAYVGEGSKAVNNYIHHNDRAGLKISGGNALIENNELSYNNYRDLEDPLWDVGGVKLAWPGENNIIRNNWAHHNHGAGIWFDIDNNNGIVENNLVEDNTHVGIVTEISQGSIIRNNTVNRNGLVYGPMINWGWGNGIQVQSARDIEIYGNVLDGNYNGIMIVENGRGYGFDDVDVYNNTVKNSVHWAAGAVEGGSGGPFGLFDANVRFRNNTYSGNRTNGWAWEGNNGMTFSTWQSHGQDTGGSAN